MSPDVIRCLNISQYMSISIIIYQCRSKVLNVYKYLSISINIYQYPSTYININQHQSIYIHIYLYYIIIIIIFNIPISKYSNINILPIINFLYTVFEFWGGGERCQIGDGTIFLRMSPLGGGVGGVLVPPSFLSACRTIYIIL